MRKKSHISLAKGIIHGLDMDGRIKHRFTFYLASIWPDCIPSFLVQRHCIDDTFELFNKKMNRFVEKYKLNKDMGFVSTFRMGVITHYLADYFTFPHNSHYDGNIKDHCIYEEALKHKMYSFIDDVKASTHKKKIRLMCDIEQIDEYIKKKHSQYMSIKGNTDDDCGYSFSTCLNVVASLLQIAVTEKEALMVAA